MDYNKASLELHRTHHGKLSMQSKVQISTRDDLSIAYSPGVAEPCRRIHADPRAAYTYTAKGNMVAVVTDGSAVLGLGNIGPLAALPVMEGKAVLFKEFGGVDAVPICLDTQDPEEIIKAVKYLAPAFGGINLEDIRSPYCFEIEERLERELPIPVFHDDQHGTAIVVTAALTNALKLVKKDLKNIRAVLCGPGAAGTAIIKMLLHKGIGSILAVDEHGILAPGRPEGLEGHKAALAALTNPTGISGSLSDAVKGADLFVGVSVAGALSAQMVKTMAERPIVFAMANPNPEIPYEEAVAAGVWVMGTGRSDCPNQINNVLAFPGLFKGALSVRASEINPQMKAAAAEAIASVVAEDELRREYIIPSPLDSRVAQVVADAVAAAALATGVGTLVEETL